MKESGLRETQIYLNFERQSHTAGFESATVAPWRKSLVIKFSAKSSTSWWLFTTRDFPYDQALSSPLQIQLCGSDSVKTPLENRGVFGEDF